MPERDMLEHIFEMQADLNKRIGVDTTAMPDEQQKEWLLNYGRAMTQEIAELTDCVPWKWWAKYQTFDKQNARVEIVDILHFLISAAQVVGLSAQDVYDAYTAKNKVNVQRQESGYTTKDEHDCRHV